MLFISKIFEKLSIDHIFFLFRHRLERSSANRNRRLKIGASCHIDCNDYFTIFHSSQVLDCQIFPRLRIPGATTFLLTNLPVIYKNKSTVLYQLLLLRRIINKVSLSQLSLLPTPFSGHYNF